jgi:predicted flap endonuclease-1-like 5' DNA nuclease
MTPAPHGDAGGQAITGAAGPSPVPTTGAASHTPTPTDGFASAVPAEAAPTYPAASPSPLPDASIPAPVGATTPAEAGLAAARPVAPGEPPTVARVPGEDKHPGARPIGLMTARDNRADDLKRIRGIGPQNEGRLHALGIWHFDQIASWSPENVRWVSSYLAFPGRIDRERWIEQAAMLAAGGFQIATSSGDGSLGQPSVTDPTQPRPRRPRR